MGKLLLHGCGSALVTPFDKEGEVDYEAFATANMSSPDAAEMYNKARRLAMKSSSIFNEGVAFWNEEEKQRFLEEHGLKVEKIPFYYADESLTMLNGIPEAWKTVFLRNLQASFI